MVNCSVVSDSLQPHELHPASLFCPWGFSKQEYWSGLPCPPPGDLLNPGMEPRPPALQADSLPAEPPGKPCVKGNGHQLRAEVLSPTLPRRSFPARILLPRVVEASRLRPRLAQTQRKASFFDQSGKVPDWALGYISSPTDWKAEGGAALQGSCQPGRGGSSQSSCETVFQSGWRTEQAQRASCCRHLEQAAAILSRLPRGACLRRLLSWGSGHSHCFTRGTLVWNSGGQASARGSLRASETWLSTKGKRKVRLFSVSAVQFSRSVDSWRFCFHSPGMVMGFAGDRSLFLLLSCSLFLRGAEGWRSVFCNCFLLITGACRHTLGRGAELLPRRL